MQVHHLRSVASSRQALSHPPPTTRRPDPVTRTHKQPMPADRGIRTGVGHTPQVCALNLQPRTVFRLVARAAGMTRTKPATSCVRRSERCRMTGADTRAATHTAHQGSPRAPLPWPPFSRSARGNPRLVDPILPSPSCFQPTKLQDIFPRPSPDAGNPPICGPTVPPELPSECPNPASRRNAQPSALLSNFLTPRDGGYWGGTHRSPPPPLASRLSHRWKPARHGPHSSNPAHRAKHATPHPPREASSRHIFFHMEADWSASFTARTNWSAGDWPCLRPGERNQIQNLP